MRTPFNHTTARSASSPRGASSDDARQGTILVICIICLVLLSLTAGVLIRASGLHRDHSRTLLPQSQAQWLAEAGIQLAAQQLESNPDWSGKTWTASPEQTGLDTPARIAITVSTGPQLNQPPARIATITVDLPPDSDQRVRVVHKVRFNAPTASQ